MATIHRVFEAAGVNCLHCRKVGPIDATKNGLIKTMPVMQTNRFFGTLLEQRSLAEAFIRCDDGLLL